VKLPSSDSGRTALQNTGGEELRHLFVYEIGVKGRQMAGDGPPETGKTQSLVLDSSSTTPRFGARRWVRKALVAEGLYEREAARE
jgi:hypothetical protein